MPDLSQILEHPAATCFVLYFLAMGIHNCIEAWRRK